MRRLKVVLSLVLQVLAMLLPNTFKRILFGVVFGWACSGGIRIGDRCLIGGRDSQCWTHFFDSRDGIARIEWRELAIADRCYIGARATLLYCKIPSDSVVGAGAVVTKDFSTEGPGLLLAGNPAEIKKRFA
jgi:acetyltransferase-like isoleucine patch superfamily enzyme